MFPHASGLQGYYAFTRIVDLTTFPSIILFLRAVAGGSAVRWCVCCCSTSSRPWRMTSGSNFPSVISTIPSPRQPCHVMYGSPRSGEHCVSRRIKKIYICLNQFLRKETGVHFVEVCMTILLVFNYFLHLLPPIRDVINWLFAAIVKSTGDKDNMSADIELKTQKEKDEHLK